MKKLLALLLALTTATALTACGEKKTEAPAPVEEPAAREAVRTVKAGLVLIGDENDQGYTYNFLRGKESADRVRADEGITVDWVIKYGLLEGDPVALANEDLAETGCEIIFNNSYNHEAAVLPVAAEYPDVQFVCMTGDQAWADNLSNTHNAFVSIYEGRYCAGVVAGLKLQELIDSGAVAADEAVIGYVGAYPFAEVVSGYTAYYLGARSVCPSVTMKVRYVNSWSDADAEAAAAASLADAGCLVISQHSDNATAAVVAQSKGVFHTGYNNDMIDVAPDASLISTRIDWTHYFVHAIECIADGADLEQDWCNGMAQGEVVMTELNEAIAAPGTAEKLAETEAAIQNGTLKVFDVSTFTVDGETLTSYTDARVVDGIEMIVDGAYAESTIRSAPYFDLRIDGITELN